MRQKILLLITSFFLIFVHYISINMSYAEWDNYMVMRAVDKWSFNEYTAMSQISTYHFTEHTQHSAEL